MHAREVHGRVARTSGIPCSNRLNGVEAGYWFHVGQGRAGWPASSEFLVY